MQRGALLRVGAHRQRPVLALTGARRGGRSPRGAGVGPLPRRCLRQCEAGALDAVPIGRPQGAAGREGHTPLEDPPRPSQHRGVPGLRLICAAGARPGEPRNEARSRK